MVCGAPSILRTGSLLLLKTCNLPKMAIFVTAIVTMCYVSTTCRIALFDGQHKEDITIVLDDVLRIYLRKCSSVFDSCGRGGNHLNSPFQCFVC